MFHLPDQLHPALVHFPIVLLILGGIGAVVAVFMDRWNLRKSTVEWESAPERGVLGQGHETFEFVWLGLGGQKAARAVCLFQEVVVKENLVNFSEPLWQLGQFFAGKLVVVYPHTEQT